MKPYHLSLVLFAASLCLCETYTLRNSWAVAFNDAVSEEEAVPVVLVDNSGLWKPAYPHSVLQDGAEKPKESVKSKTKDAAPMSSAFRVFSYRMEEMTVPSHLHHTRIRRGPSDTWPTTATEDISPPSPLKTRQQMYDPEDPCCARLTLTGKMGEVDPEEVEFAKEAMFSRHPVMKKWLVGHNWFVMKLQLTQVWLQDWVGGVSLIPLEDYFKATPY
ncbi:protein CREG2-like [Oncorhynchus clarkii lewisi]|uniref:protein CREG2-like n=1 Tax=Oncorhynchus clarkii lewisi TaxID=490388 RepID=UPI0039B97DD8